MKLVLGAVQFGMSYGVTNETGIVERAEIKRILADAQKFNVGYIDTAINYGRSEIELGNAGANSFKIITKLPKLPAKTTDVKGWVKDQLSSSMYRLKTKKLYGLLLHYPTDLLSQRGAELHRALIAVKGEELVQKIGISIYSPAELDSIWGKYNFDIVQSPFNLIDRRLEKSGWMSRLANNKVEIHARSIFLQGILLSKLENLPPYFSKWRPLFFEWRDWLTQQSNDPLKACLDFVQSRSEIDKVIFGVQSKDQLFDIVSASKFSHETNWPDISCEDPMLVDPSRWET